MQVCLNKIQSLTSLARCTPPGTLPWLMNTIVDELSTCCHKLSHLVWPGCEPSYRFGRSPIAIVVLVQQYTWWWWYMWWWWYKRSTREQLGCWEMPPHKQVGAAVGVVQLRVKMAGTLLYWSCFPRSSACNGCQIKCTESSKGERTLGLGQPEASNGVGLSAISQPQPQSAHQVLAGPSAVPRRERYVAWATWAGATTSA